MNKARRKQIAAIVAKIEEAKAELETIRDDEQNYYDGMPEGPQAGERGEKAQAAIDAIEEAIGEIENTVDHLNTATE